MTDDEAFFERAARRRARRVHTAETAKRSAYQDLVDADAEAESPYVHVQKKARKLRRIAKRDAAKAERRIGRAQCQWSPEELEED